MKIISRYVLREHAGPLMFALTALTALMLLNYISRQFGELVGKGLPWSVIGEFFMLSVPFTVALTLPMSVLVAVLYAYSRLAAENEVTALKASGVSPWRLVNPALVGGVVMTLALLAFNDQVLPRANHRLKTLQEDISQTKPTLALKEQVINPIAEGKFYLKAGRIDPSGGRLKEVVIYDLADPTRRRTIYADSGLIAFAANRVDLDLTLFHGQMQEVSTEKPTQLDRLFYARDRIRIRDVGRDFKQSQSDSTSKGDREMGICEMQGRLRQANGNYLAARRDYDRTVHLSEADALKAAETASAFVPVRAPEPHGIGWVYCSLLRGLVGVRSAQAAEVGEAALHRSAGQDTSRRVPSPVRGSSHTAPQLPAPATPVRLLPPSANPVPQAATSGAGEITADQRAYLSARAHEAKIRLDIAQRGRDRYEIEIHKKFSLAAACLIFCIVGPPIALRFPRGGVGLVIGVSLAVFALYYVGLIGGESLANNGHVPPFWAMWGTNVIMTLVGFVLMLRMGRDSGSTRGGGLRDWLDDRRERRRARQSALVERPA